MTSEAEAMTGPKQPREPRTPLGRPGLSWRGDGALGGAIVRPAAVRAPASAGSGKMAELGLTVAPFHLRVVAFLVDNLLLAIVTGIAFAIAGVEIGSTAEDIVARAQEVAPYYTVAEVLLRWPWNAIGWSPGKRLVGLRTVDAVGRPPGVLRGLARSFAALLSELLPFGPGYLWAAWDRERRTWHDRLAGTWVVRAPSEEPPRS